MKQQVHVHVASHLVAADVLQGAFDDAEGLLPRRQLEIITLQFEQAGRRANKRLPVGEKLTKGNGYPKQGRLQMELGQLEKGCCSTL